MKQVSSTHDLSDLGHTLLALNTQTRQAPIWPFCRWEPWSVVCELPHPYTDGGVWVPSPHSPKPMILTECTKLLFLLPPFRPQVLISFPQVCSSLKRSSWLLCQRIRSDWVYTHTHTHTHTQLINALEPWDRVSVCNCNFPGKGKDSGQEDKLCAGPLHWNGLGKCVRVCVCVCVEGWGMYEAGWNL